MPLSRFTESASRGGYFFTPHLNSTTKRKFLYVLSVAIYPNSLPEICNSPFSTRNIFSGSLFLPFVFRKVYQPFKFLPLNNGFIFFLDEVPDCFFTVCCALVKMTHSKKPMQKIFFIIVFVDEPEIFFSNVLEI